MWTRENGIACLVLAVLTLAVYGQALGFEFVRFDDPRYVTENPQVQAGLTADSVRWAFTTFHKSNWHPLTWLSHMLDVELFGLDPSGHHATSVLLHLLNAWLVFFALRALTGDLAPSFGVAAVFAVHPLHVESVAWIAERKDVLSSTFGLLALWAYAGYAWEDRRRLWWVSLGCFALSLLAKPMWVTLPCVFLLLDRWPLARLGSWREGLVRALEKLPFFLLSAGSSVVTLEAQRAGGATAWLDPNLGERLASGAVAYATYLWKGAMPIGLGVFYPHPYSASGVAPSSGEVTAALALLAAITALVAWSRQGSAWTGWLWFIGTLFPVSGFVQAGLQGMADRYTYYPSLGLSIAIAWAIRAQLRDRPLRLRRAAAVCGVLLLAAWTVAAWHQTRTWRDSVTLFEHALAVAPSATIHNNLGAVHGDAGSLDAALHHYERAVALDPGHRVAHRNLALQLRARREFRRATRHWLLAQDIPLDSAQGELSLGVADEASGDLDAAVDRYRRALQLQPELAAARERLEAAEAARDR
ncbi:MAG: hypothetical protein AAF430_07235 [Myxococcota bacterium]